MKYLIIGVIITIMAMVAPIFIAPIQCSNFQANTGLRTNFSYINGCFVTTKNNDKTLLNQLRGF